MCYVVYSLTVVTKKDGYEIRKYSTNQTAFFTAAYVGSSDFATAVKVSLLLALVKRLAEISNRVYSDHSIMHPLKTYFSVVAQQSGFDANFKYISGANDKKEKIPMTAPVTFTRDHATDGWYVGFFVPSTYRTKDEVPKPTDESISIVEVP